MVGNAPYADGSTQSLDDAMDRRQAQSCALIQTLGGEQWLEDPSLNSLIHAMACIRYLQDCTVVGAQRADRKPPADRHGVSGVCGKIHQHLLELGRIGANHTGIWSKLGFQNNVRSDKSL